MSSLKIIVPENFIEFGEKVNSHLQKMRNEENNYIIPTNSRRFINYNKI